MGLGVEVTMSLTGRFWFKKTWQGRLILLVEEKKARWFKPDEFKLRWREARLIDFAESALQPLMDLGRISRPTYSSSRLTPLKVVERPTEKAS
jgi:hypothetical protein